MRFKTRFNAAGGIADFWQEFRRPNPYRWPILAASLAMTGSLLFWVMGEKYYLPPEQPKVVIIQTFAAGRSDAEIILSNIENQKRQDRLAAEQAAREEEVKDAYRALGRATGIDVDAMEADIARDGAREAAQHQAEQATDRAVAPAPR